MPPAVTGRRFAAALLPRLFGTNPRSHHKGATGRVRTGDQRLPDLCHCQFGQDTSLCSPWSYSLGIGPSQEPWPGGSKFSTRGTSQILLDCMLRIRYYTVNWKSHSDSEPEHGGHKVILVWVTVIRWQTWQHLELVCPRFLLLGFRQWPEVYDSCHTIACDSHMALCFLTRATCKNVRQNLIPWATAYRDWGVGFSSWQSPPLAIIHSLTRSVSVTGTVRATHWQRESSGWRSG